MKTITYDETEWKLVPLDRQVLPEEWSINVGTGFQPDIKWLELFGPNCSVVMQADEDAITLRGLRKFEAATLAAAPEPPASGTGFVKLCIYERSHGTFATLGDRVLFGAVISPTGQPTRTYKIPLDDLREIIDHAIRTGEQE